jgi:RNA polymerase sigma-70 factor (ECF subfamily)
MAKAHNAVVRLRRLTDVTLWAGHAMNQAMNNGSRSDPEDEDVDGALLVRARTSPDMFGQFYDRNLRSVLTFFYQRTACGEVAADLTAETFTAVLAGLHRFHPAKGTGRSWMFGIATNLHRQYLRRGYVETKARRRLGINTPELDNADLERIETAIDFEPYVPLLAGALASLTPNVRAAVQLRIHDQLPYKEIAERLGCTEVSARVRVSRGLDSLHTHLGASL